MLYLLSKHSANIDVSIKRLVFVIFA